MRYTAEQYTKAEKYRHDWYKSKDYVSIMMPWAVVSQEAQDRWVVYSQEGL